MRVDEGNTAAGDGLTPREVELIREIVEPVSSRWYDESDWA